MSNTFQAFVTPAPDSDDPIVHPSPSLPPQSPLLSPTDESKGRKLGFRRSISNLFLQIRPGSVTPESSRAPSPVLSHSSFDSISSDDVAFNDLRDNGWDIEAVKRRGKGYKTASASERLEILKLYDTLQIDLGKKPSKEQSKAAKKASHRLLRILMLCVLEHDERNFPELLKLVESRQMSFITFIRHIPDFRKAGAEYMKTFLVAAFVNWKQFEPSEIEEAERTFTDFVYSMSRYDNGLPRVPSVHARANIIYAVQYLHHSEKLKRSKLTSKDYDNPYVSPFSRSWEPTGIPQARVDQVKCGEQVLSGFFEVHSSEERKMIEKGQDSKPKTKEPAPDDKQVEERPSTPPPAVQYVGRDFLEQTGLHTNEGVSLTEEPAEISNSPAVLVESAPLVDDREVWHVTIQFKHLKGKVEALQNSLGLSKSEIPMGVKFTEERPDKTWEWSVESGTLDLKTGCAEFDLESRNGKIVNYNFWITPWAIVGERLVDGASRGVYLFSWP